MQKPSKEDIISTAQGIMEKVSAEFGPFVALSMVDAMTLSVMQAVSQGEEEWAKLPEKSKLESVLIVLFLVNEDTIHGTNNLEELWDMAGGKPSDGKPSDGKPSDGKPSDAKVPTIDSLSKLPRFDA